MKDEKRPGLEQMGRWSWDRDIHRGARSSTAFVVALLAIAACGGERGPATDDRPSAPTRGARRGFITAVQLGSFADSANAITLRDSLGRAGWTAYVSPASVAGAVRWRVLVQPTAGAELPRLIQLALRAEGRDAVVVRDTIPAGGEVAPASVEILEVNRGTAGMPRRVRWALSPNRRSLLAVEDPAGVENEPVPNGFVFVSEVGPFLVQVDSVWDVAPSPDWQRLAYGRAYVVMTTRESPDDITRAQWAELAEQLGVSVDSLRRAAFVSSSMNIAYATAQPIVMDVSDRALTTDMSPAEMERTLVVLAGWRVGWSEANGALLLGTAPARAVDDAAPQRWLAVDTARWQTARAFGERASRSRVEWTEGPVLDISVPFDANAARSIRIENGRVTSRQGWIRIMREDGATESVAGGRIVGPGAVLAATATGRFIAALVPRETEDRFEVPFRFVVYQIVE